MLARPQREQYDYDNPSISMSHDITPPRATGTPKTTGSGHDIRDAGVVRPNMINILPDEPIPVALAYGGDDTFDVDPLPSDETQPKEKKPSKLKGLFGKKKKDKEPKQQGIEEVPDEIREEQPAPKTSVIGGKLKGLFKRKGGGSKLPEGDVDPVVTTPESQVSAMEVANPAYDPSNPNSPPGSPLEPQSMGVAFGEPPEKTSTMSSTKKNLFSSLLRKPPPIAKGNEEDEQAPIQLKVHSKMHHVRCSNVLNVVLIIGAVLGIIFCALGSKSATLAVIGPVFLGLGLFALVGKIFFTLFWQEDPLPRLKPYVTKAEDMFDRGRVKTEKQVVIARSSAYGNKYGIQDEDIEAGLQSAPSAQYPPPPPVPLQYEDYGQHIDTRLRAVEDERRNAPTFI